MLLRSFAAWACAMTVAIFSLGLISSAKAVEVTSGFGFSQVNFQWSSPDVNSTTGQLVCNPATLQASTGLSAGYVNVYSGGQWVVQNMPLVNGDGTGTTAFALPGSTDGTDDTSINDYVDYSATPTTGFSASPTHNYAVGNEDYDGEGDGVGDPSGVAAAPSGTVGFNAGGLTTLTYQFNHPNLEAARNQCAPAALANNLQWLHDAYGLQLKECATTYTNATGLKGDPGTSIVGRLDVLMNRTGISGASNTVANRKTGDALSRTNNVMGTLQFLTNTNNTGVVVKNEGKDGDGTGLGGNLTNGTMTTQGQGNTLQFSFILSELQAGDAVQMMYRGNGGGHAVEIVGAGTILGVNWLWYKSDTIQTDDVADPGNGDSSGTDKLDWSIIDSNNKLLNQAGTPTAQFVITEAVP